MKIKRNVLLAPYTTFRIGGPADFLVEASGENDLIWAINWAKEKDIPFIVLGGGSNVLISDKGVRGVVIINRVQDSGFKVQSYSPKFKVEQEKEIIFPRLKPLRKKEITFKDFDYDESHCPKIEVEVASGVTLGRLIDQLLRRGITGLQWFVAIPGTIGGAVFGNIHGGSHFFSEVVKEVKVLNPEGEIKTVVNNECQFDYDQSRFQTSGEIILSVVLSLYLGEVKKACWVIKEWGGFKIKNQPQNSAGCVFKNLDQETCRRLGLPTPSMSWVIDKVLGLKGKRIGGAKISEKHAGFIVNEKNAQAEDVLNLIRLVRKKAKARLGIEPDLEICLIKENGICHHLSDNEKNEEG